MTLARSRLALIGLPFIALAALFAAVRVAPAATGDRPFRVVAPQLAGDLSTTSTRSYGMGFGISPSAPTVEATIALIPELAKVSDYTIIQREAPWTRILAGIPMETIYEDEYRGMVEYLRDVNHLRLVVLVDPLDGLNRTAEAVETTKNGRTLLDPQIRTLHEQWVRLLVERIKPDYIGLASEINTLGAHGDARLYAQIRDMVNTLAPQIRTISPKSKVFVSFQVEDAAGLTPWPHSDADQYAMARDFDVDVVGLSSYPGFSYADPSKIPDDHFRRYLVAGGKPVIFVEGGWASVPVLANPGSPELQAAYYRRLFELLDGVQAELALPIIFTDLDLRHPGWGLTAERQIILEYFARMGIVDIEGQPKPAYAVWQERFKRPLIR